MNQFNPGASWYSSLFLPDNYAQVLQTFPIVLAGGSSNAPFTALGGNDQTYTQGRKVTQWQINDNLIWTHGRHSFKFGENSRRLDISDYDLGEGVVPTVIYNDLAAVHLWCGVHGYSGLSGYTERAHRLGQSRHVCDGYLQSAAKDGP